MNLEDYFDFEQFDTEFGPVERIRIKGHRITIEHVLGFYREGASPEMIVHDHYPTLTLEEVHATILYYLHDRDKVDAYLKRVEEVGEAHFQQNLRKESPDVMQRLRKLREDPETLQRLLEQRRAETTALRKAE